MCRLDLHELDHDLLAALVHIAPSLLTESIRKSGLFNHLKQTTRSKPSDLRSLPGFLKPEAFRCFNAKSFPESPDRSSLLKVLQRLLTHAQQGSCGTTPTSNFNI